VTVLFVALYAFRLMPALWRTFCYSSAVYLVFNGHCPIKCILRDPVLNISLLLRGRNIVFRKLCIVQLLCVLLLYYMTLLICV